MNTYARPYAVLNTTSTPKAPETPSGEARSPRSAPVAEVPAVEVPRPAASVPRDRTPSLSWMQRIGLGALTLYQVWISPWFGPSCRYEPSCSEYMRESILRCGLLRGGYRGIRRLGRCHPWGGSGYDPPEECTNGTAPVLAPHGGKERSPGDL